MEFKSLEIETDGLRDELRNLDLEIIELKESEAINFKD